MQSEIARWGLGGWAGFVVKIRWSSSRQLSLLIESEKEFGTL